MTVAALTPFVEYLEDGVTLNFDAKFRYGDPTNLRVSRIQSGIKTGLTYGVDWNATVAVNDDGGTVTLATTVAGSKLHIERNTERRQSADYMDTDAFPAESHETVLDQLMQIAQEQDVEIGELFSRSLRSALGETMPDLPVKSALAGNYLAFDASGNPIPAAGTGGGDAALRTDLASSASGLAIVAFILDAVGAVSRAAMYKMREMRATPGDFGGVGDAEIDATSGAITGTDDTAAVEKCIAYVATTGGEVFFPRGKLYGVVHDIEVPGNVRLVGENERGPCGIAGLSSGVFTEALVKMGDGSDIIFSSGARNMLMRATDIGVPILLWISPQEDSAVENCIINGTLGDYVVRIMSTGFYNSGSGSASSGPAHGARFSGNHVIAGTGTALENAATNGVRLDGCDRVKVDHNTVTMPIRQRDGSAQNKIGGIGIEWGYSVVDCGFPMNYCESFTSPMKYTGSDCWGNDVSLFKVYCIGTATVPAGATIFETVDYKIVPLSLRLVRSQGNLYDYFYKLGPGISLNRPKTDLVSNRLARLDVWQVDFNGPTQYVIEDDVSRREPRQIYRTGMDYSSFQTIDDADTSPSVATGNLFVTANTGATSITTFDDGVSGQCIEVHCGDANTTFVHGSGMVLQGGANFAAGLNNVLVLRRRNVSWQEVSRRT